MNKIACLKAQIRNSPIEHAKVRPTPNGEPPIDYIDRLDKNGQLNFVYLRGAPNRWTDTTEWTEVWYPSGKKGRIVTGWIATNLLDISPDPLHDTGETVHERQVRYEDSVKFPPRDTLIRIPDKLFRTKTEAFCALLAFAGALFFIAEYIVAPLYEVLFP